MHFIVPNLSDVWPVTRSGNVVHFAGRPVVKRTESTDISMITRDEKISFEGADTALYVDLGELMPESRFATIDEKLIEDLNIVAGGTISGACRFMQGRFKMLTALNQERPEPIFSKAIFTPPAPPEQ